MKSMNSNFFFVFRYIIFVFDYKNQTKNDKNIMTFDENFLIQMRKRNNKLSQIKNN